MDRRRFRLTTDPSHFSPVATVEASMSSSCATCGASALLAARPLAAAAQRCMAHSTILASAFRVQASELCRRQTWSASLHAFTHIIHPAALSKLRHSDSQR
jgi:hypothetical protein